MFFFKKKFFEYSIKEKIIFIFLSLFVILFFSCLLYILIPIKSKDLIKISEFSGVILDRNDMILRNVFSENDVITSEFVNSKEISENMKKAIISVEDKRFYSHIGIDFRSLARAFLLNLKEMKIVAGGSTITQQLSKLILKNEKRTFLAKICETLLALRIELYLTKDDILSLYLNRVSYGSYLQGIGEASECYFGKKTSELSIAQSAFLASIPLLPSYYDPYRNIEAVFERKDLILSLMKEQGLISELEYRNALDEKIVVQSPNFQFEAPHFCDYLISEYKKNNKTIHGKIRTTLDLKLQHEVENILKSSVFSLNKNNVTNGAVLVIDNKTGNILSMVGSVDFFEKDGQVNGCLATRQAGSTLKPFVYALALESGMMASDIIPDIKITVNDQNGSFSPLNYDRKYHGPVRLRNALACSYNIPAFRTVLDIGVGNLYKRLKEIGFSSLDKRPEWYGPGIALGNGEVSLKELVSAYRCFSNNGKTITTKFLLEDDVHESENVFSDKVSYIIFDILSDNEARTPAFGRNSYLRLPFKCAVKTGTTKNYRDNWCIGTTSEYTVGVWVGNFDSSSMKNISGVTGAGPVFYNIMRYLYKNSKPEDVACPEGIIQKKVCSLSGKLPNPYCKDIVKELFISESMSPTEECDFHKLLNIDVRTGYLASDSVSKKYLKAKVCEIYPDIYYEWAKEKGIKNFSEKIISNFSNSRKKLNITFPSDGDVFVIDKTVEEDHQKIVFHLVCLGNLNRVTWKLNGKILGEVKEPFSYEWKLKEGNYILEAISENGSDSVSFTVK